MKVTGLYFAGALVGTLAAACGGSTATVPGTDAGGNSASSSGSGSGSGSSSGDVASSSSSSGAGASSSGSSGMTNPGGMNLMLTCLDSSSCNSGEVCCVMVAGMGATSACAAACAANAYQFCAKTAECVRPGEVCTPVPMSMGRASVCYAGGGGQPKADAGTMQKDDAGPSSDGQASLDAGMDGARAVTDGSSTDGSSGDGASE